MSTQPTTPKPPRGSRRTPKRVATTPVQPSSMQGGKSPAANHHSTPRGTPPSPSREEKPTYDSSNNLSEGGAGKKKGKKNNRNKNTNPSPMSNGTGGHRHSSSQPSINSPPAARDSPRYAGPTFHASPAPSALPIPTFFSKSVPDANLPESIDDEDDTQDTDPGETTPSKIQSAPQVPTVEEHPSPLDFLFKAARDSKAATQVNGVNGCSERGSPVRQTTPHSQKSQATEGAVFPFELENSESKSMDIGPSFATPYKERMNAFRSTSSPSRSANNMPFPDEQKKVKSETLKDLLLNPRPQRPSSASPQFLEKPLANPHSSGSSPSTPQNAPHGPVRHSSGPATPVSSDQQHTPSKPVNGVYGKDTIPHQYLASVCNSARTGRTPSSNLRKEVTPSNPASPSDRARHLSSPGAHSSDFSESVGNFLSPTSTSTVSPPPSGSSPARTGWKDPNDMRRMENDLRRILNLDSKNAHTSRDMGHSIA